jgi:hypothetical protein
MQYVKEELNKDIEILKNQINVLEMKSLIFQIKASVKEIEDQGWKVKVEIK